MTDESKGLVLDMPFAEYNADPCEEPSLRSSLVKTLIRETPYHAWGEHPKLNPHYVERREDKFDLGAAAHELVVGGEKRIEIIDAKDWRTNAAKEAREAARQEGKLPVLPTQLERMQQMSHHLHVQLDEGDDHGAFEGGIAEASLIWKEDVWFRARPDWLPDRSAAVAYDYKTVGVSLSEPSLERYAGNMGFDKQAALIARGLQMVLGAKDPEVRFVCQEDHFPFSVRVIHFSAYALALAEQEIDRAAKLWRRCLDKKSWPGWPAQALMLDPPPYQAAERESRLEE